MSEKPAEPSIVWCVAKTSVQTVVIWTLALVLVPWIILTIEQAIGLDWTRFEGRWQGWFGAGIFVVASAVGLVSAWTMAILGAGTPLPLDPARRLVVAGPYRWVRNPMAISGLSQGLGVAVFVGSWSLVAYVGAGFVFWNYCVRRWEEKDLVRRFGKEYEEYRIAVRCWWPRLRPFDPSRAAGQ